VCLNLDSAEARKTQIEANFAQNKGPGWTWARFPAVVADGVGDVPGRLRPAEKACFLSHKRALASHLNSEGPVFILEDDALFGPHTAQTIDRIVFANDNLAWDLLYTDVCVPQASSMIELLKLRRQLDVPREVRLINLRGFPYAGATAYIVNARSIAKLLALLESESALDVPYDLHLRNLVNSGRLRAYAFFPFLTSLSAAADESQVQPQDAASADVVWNLFRRMVWIDRDLELHREALERIGRDLCDEELRAFGVLFGVMSSSKLAPR